MNIYFNNFKREYKNNKTHIDEAIQRVLKSGWFILGKEVLSFELDLAKFLKVNYCITVGNGTDAIYLALLSLGIKSGDEVITTNLTAYATIVAIQETGATPVVVDIHEETGLIDENEIEKHITQRTKVIIPVHLYGQACNMSKIMKIARIHKLKVVEDCAQAIAAKYKNQFVGTFGELGTISFYPTKNLGAYGDGGAIITNNKKYYEKLLMLRNYGQSKRYYHDEKGINSRLDEIQAAILKVKLTKLNKNIQRRREIAHYYNSHLKKIDFIPEAKDNYHTYHLYVIKSKKREELIKYLASKSVASLVHYPVPITEQKAFTLQKREMFIHTKKFTEQIVSLPIYPELSNREIEYVSKIINNFNNIYG